MTFDEAREILLSDPEGAETPADVWQDAIELYNYTVYEHGPLVGKKWD